MGKELADEKDITLLYSNIVSMIDNTKEKVYKSVNTELINLYWNIGRTIKEDIIKEDRADYGKQVVEILSKELTLNYGSGYSKSNIFRMIKFYETFAQEIVATLSQQLTWSHFRELITIEDNLKREFYGTMCRNDRWSVRTLRERISSMLYERTALSKKPEETIINDLEKKIK